MPSKLSHFAIYIDDMDRARSFYSSVFKWGFSSYGQSDFFQIKSEEGEAGELLGAIQSRSYSPIPDKVNGYECTISVENLDEIIELVEKEGGKLVMPKATIPYVGFIAKFLDTEGNLFCAMQYNPQAR